MMNILITGGSGFVGSNLINALTDSNVILNIDKNESKWHKSLSKILNINDEENLNKIQFQADLLIHLAAEHRDDVKPKSLYQEVNVEGTKNIIKFAESKNINSIIFFSSVAVYGFADKGTDESGIINPFNDYGSTKWLAEVELNKWYKKDPKKRRLIVIRPTVIFGPRNRGNFYNLIDQVASSRFLMVGRGENFKSLAYIDNVIDFVSKTLELDEGNYCFNFIDKPESNMNMIMSVIYKALGKKKPKIYVPFFIAYTLAKLLDILSFMSRKQFSISSIRIKKFCSDTSFETSVSKIGFKSKYSIEDAIKKTIDYEFNNPKKDDTVFFTE